MGVLRPIILFGLLQLKFEGLPLDFELLAAEDLLVLGVGCLLIEEIPNLHLLLLGLKLCRLCLLYLGLALPLLLLWLSSLIHALEDFDYQLIEFLSWGPIDERRHVLNQLLRWHHRMIWEIFF